MKYKALYRKYRPQKFEDVVGQDPIVKTLQNSITENKISHAYLFCGPRGSGKTSVAKLFAKTVNCIDNKKGETCNKCEVCLQLENIVNSDIIEIDAASNNGVDEIRELRSKVNLLPSVCNYKVYIIDEVHMLSTAAFNALLKTLEEPPAHVIFILATTEAHKLPSTIISRCQRFDFKKISVGEIELKIKDIATKEGISINSGAINLIARIADGGLRDAIGLLDQLSLYNNEKIEEVDVAEVVGVVSKKDIIEIFDTIVCGLPNEFLNKIDHHHGSGKDLIKLVEELMIYTKDIMVYSKAPEYFESVNAEEYKRLSSFPDVDPKKVVELVNVLNTLLEKMVYSSYPKLLLEVNVLNHITSNQPVAPIGSTKKEEQKKVIEVCSVIEEPKEIEFEEKPEKKESKHRNKKTMIIDITKLEELTAIRVNNSFAEANKGCLQKVKSNWQTIGEYALDREIGVAAGLLLDGEPKVASENCLIIAYPYQTVADRTNNLLIEAEKVLKKVANCEYKIAAITNEKWEELRVDFISKTKKGEKFIVKEEIEYLKEEIEEVESEKANNKSIVEIFGDLVELK